MNAVLVKNLMTPYPMVISQNATLVEAAKKMNELKCGILPVGSRLNLVGMITDRDIVVRGIAVGVDPHVAQVHSCMTNYMYFCHDTDTLEDALNEMLKEDVGRLLVYDNNRKICGIITLGSVIRHTVGKVKVKEFITGCAENNFTD